MTLPDLPPDLVSRAQELNFSVRITDPTEDEFLLITKYSAYIDPKNSLITISGSLSERETRQALAHEIGHAEQWRFGGTGLYRVGCDAVSYFNCEMDAVKRGERYTDMRENYWSNFFGYSERLGLEHLGRS